MDARLYDVVSTLELGFNMYVTEEAKEFALSIGGEKVLKTSFTLVIVCNGREVYRSNHTTEAAARRAGRAQLKQFEQDPFLVIARAYEYATYK